MAIARVNYLNNKDILKEIHKSKISYCWFKTPEDADYDFIVRSFDEIPTALQSSIEKVINEDGDEVEVFNPPAAKVARTKRLIVAAQDKALEGGVKLKADEVGITYDQIKDTDVVFRVMTWGHIPEAPPAPPKVKKGKKAQVIEFQDDEDSIVTEYDEDVVEQPTKYVKVNFPPFEHYKYDETGTLVCVGRSHWKGDLETGHFCRDHGQMTRKLGHMFIRLSEKYATKSNWRGYSYTDEMKSQAQLQLTQIGLQFDESKGSNPFAYYTTTITNSFTRVLQIEKRNQHIRDDILETYNLNPSYTRQFQNTNHNNDE